MSSHVAYPSFEKIDQITDVRPSFENIDSLSELSRSKKYSIDKSASLKVQLKTRLKEKMEEGLDFSPALAETMEEFFGKKLCDRIPYSQLVSNNPSLFTQEQYLNKFLMGVRIYLNKDFLQEAFWQIQKGEATYEMDCLYSLNQESCDKICQYEVFDKLRQEELELLCTPFNCIMSDVSPIYEKVTLSLPNDRDKNASKHHRLLQVFAKLDHYESRLEKDPFDTLDLNLSSEYLSHEIVYKLDGIEHPKGTLFPALDKNGKRTLLEIKSLHRPGSGLVCYCANRLTAGQYEYKVKTSFSSFFPSSETNLNFFQRFALLLRGVAWKTSQIAKTVFSIFGKSVELRINYLTRIVDFDEKWEKTPQTSTVLFRGTNDLAAVARNLHGANPINVLMRGGRPGSISFWEAKQFLLETIQDSLVDCKEDFEIDIHGHSLGGIDGQYLTLLLAECKHENHPFFNRLKKVSLYVKNSPGIERAHCKRFNNALATLSPEKVFSVQTQYLLSEGDPLQQFGQDYLSARYSRDKEESRMCQLNKRLQTKLTIASTYTPPILPIFNHGIKWVNQRIYDCVVVENEDANIYLRQQSLTQRLLAPLYGMYHFVKRILRSLGISFLGLQTVPQHL